jgi:hypothetical protein
MIRVEPFQPMLPEALLPANEWSHPWSGAGVNRNGAFSRAQAGRCHAAISLWGLALRILNTKPAASPVTPSRVGGCEPPGRFIGQSEIAAFAFHGCHAHKAT